MDAVHELADRIGNSADLGVEVLRAAGAIWNPPVQLDWNGEQFLDTLSALTALLSLAFVFVENLAYLNEQVRAVRTFWDNSNTIHRVMMLLHLFTGLAQTNFPGLVSQGWAYLMQGHLQVCCRQLWNSSSQEVKLGVAMVLLWLAIVHICLPSYRWLSQGP